MDDMTLLSTEAEGVNDTIPEDFKPSHVNGAGRVGALLGLTDDGSPSGMTNHRVQYSRENYVMFVNVMCV